MGALPRPDLAPGPARELNDALHELHHRAGWPSLRTLAHDAGCSHTTVSHVFSSPKLPTWGVLELLVEAMHGDPAPFHDLWLSASSPRGSEHAPQIAGRRTELVAVRRHLESGNGLFLVTGEAGIGKTRLVTAAAAGSGVFVATGTCLPLSVQDPLMPIIDVLRAVHEHDDGRSLKEALSDLHPYVREALAHLLPELSDGSVAAVFDGPVRQHVFSAVGSCLSRLAELGAAVVVLEDLHWADNATLDLLEHLVAGESGPPVIGTWRTEDLGVSDVHTEWLRRVQRLSRASTIELAPLTLAETTAQLALGIGAPVDPSVAARVYERSRGHPLFTEHLAVDPGGVEGPLPSRLADVLDHRLAGLTHDALAVVTTLGVADRDLADPVMRHVTGLDHERLVSALHELRGRHLLATQPSRTTQLRHPLLAEAARRRLVPAEAAHAHASLARAMAEHTHDRAAEIAEHWREAGDAVQELPWRVEAAHQAHSRTAPDSEADQWLRALELAADGNAGDEFDRVAAQLAAFDSLELAGRLEDAVLVIQQAMTDIEDLDDLTAAEVLRRAAQVTANVIDDVPASLALSELAIGLLEPHGATEALVHALDIRANQLMDLGRNKEATDSLRRALAVCDELADPGLFFGTSASLAWHLAHMGDLESALATIRAARERHPGSAGPRRESYMAMMHTDALIKHRRPAEEVLAAAEPALALGRELRMDFHYLALVRTNVAEALVNTGRIRLAAEHLAQFPTSDAYDHWSLRWMAAEVAVAEGRPDDCLELMESLARQLGQGPANQLARAHWIAIAQLWKGRPEIAWEVLVPAIETMLDSPLVMDYGVSFNHAARAAAELAHHDRRSVPRRLHARLVDLRERAVVDPFGPGLVPVTRPAVTAQWHAELSRIDHRDTLEQWGLAARSWDALNSPHDSAYCLWRAAQVALREGQGTAAARLLKRAALSAREHVPLTRAIAATGAS